MRTLIGDVEETWAEVELGVLCEVTAGPSTNAFKSEPPGNVPIQIIAPRDFRYGRVMPRADLTISEGGIRRLERYRLLAGDVVTARTGDLGKQAYVEDNRKILMLGTSCLRIRPMGDILPQYILSYLDHPVVQDWISRRASSATIMSITSSALESLPVALPPMDVQLKIADLISAFDMKLAAHDDVVRATSELRAAVLPLAFMRP
jgi:type I restriction enzyme, S subunit